MTETIFDPGGCVGCDTDGRCMGKTNCKYCYSEIHYCDECGKEINDGDLCESCKEMLEEDEE